MGPVTAPRSRSSWEKRNLQKFPAPSANPGRWGWSLRFQTRSASLSATASHFAWSEKAAPSNRGPLVCRRTGGETPLLAAGLGRWLRLDLLERQRPPELECAVAAAGEEGIAVVAESDAPDPLAVPLQNGHLLVNLRMP